MNIIIIIMIINFHVNSDKNIYDSNNNFSDNDNDDIIIGNNIVLQW